MSFRTSGGRKERRGEEKTSKIGKAASHGRIRFLLNRLNGVSLFVEMTYIFKLPLPLKQKSPKPKGPRLFI